VNIYPFIEAEKSGGHNVSRACALLQVSRAAYAHRNSPSTRQRADAELTTQIAAVAGTDDRPAAQSDTSTPPIPGSRGSNSGVPRQRRQAGYPAAR
jgi:hypothetical protein